LTIFKSRTRYEDERDAPIAASLANLARHAEGDCYADLLDALALEVESAA
jgi:hypothetical protein